MKMMIDAEKAFDMLRKKAAMAYAGGMKDERNSPDDLHRGHVHADQDLHA